MRDRNFRWLRFNILFISFLLLKINAFLIPSSRDGHERKNRKMRCFQKHLHHHTTKSRLMWMKRSKIRQITDFWISLCSLSRNDIPSHNRPSLCCALTYWVANLSSKIFCVVHNRRNINKPEKCAKEKWREIEKKSKLPADFSLKKVTVNDVELKIRLDHR